MLSSTQVYLLVFAGMETSDVQGVLDGNLEPFMSAYLRMKGQQATQEELERD